MTHHNIDPLYSKESKILILGSFPSVKSRESQFFYGHPQNRFWKVISSLLNDDCPKTIEQKKQLLLKNNIAAWDVIQSCDIEGSSDSSITNITINDFSKIFKTADICQVFANGNKSYSLYKKYVSDNIIKLPSTSPANAQFSLDKLITEWKIILNFL